MLCITRKVDEAVSIGDGIKVFIVDISGKTVTLGIIADRKEFPVKRVGRKDERPTCSGNLETND